MLPLRPGSYSWYVSLFGDGKELDTWEGAPDMVVATESYQHPQDQWNGVLNIPASFEINGKR
jgi:hypothetical protein